MSSTRQLTQTGVQVKAQSTRLRWPTDKEFVGTSSFDPATFEAAFRDLKLAFAVRSDHYRTKKHDLVFAANERSIFLLDVIDVGIRPEPKATKIVSNLLAGD